MHNLLRFICVLLIVINRVAATNSKVLLLTEPPRQAAYLQLVFALPYQPPNCPPGERIRAQRKAEFLLRTRSNLLATWESPLLSEILEFKPDPLLGRKTIIVTGISLEVRQSTACNGYARSVTLSIAGYSWLFVQSRTEIL